MEHFHKNNAFGKELMWAIARPQIKTRYEMRREGKGWVLRGDGEFGGGKMRTPNFETQSLINFNFIQTIQYKKQSRNWSRATN